MRDFSEAPREPGSDEAVLTKIGIRGATELAIGLGARHRITADVNKVAQQAS